MSRWRVRVRPTDAGRTAVVFVTRKLYPSWHGDGVIVAEVSLSAPDADEKLADARARAADYATQIEELEK